MLRKNQIIKIKAVFDNYLKSVDLKKHILHDPIYFPHQYSKKEDIDLAAFIASCFSYGKQKLFFEFLKTLFNKLHNYNKKMSLYEIILNFNLNFNLSEINYRFNKTNDIKIFLMALSNLIKKFKTISNIIETEYKINRNLILSISKLREKFFNEVDEIVQKNNLIFPKSLNNLVPDILKGSPCKRLFMYLRWMVREDEVDFGIIKTIPKNELIIPLDTHIHRLSLMFGLTNRTDYSLKTAIDITNTLKLLDNKDPIKYDFALCLIGIIGFCTKGHEGKNCKNCKFNIICKYYEIKEAKNKK